MTRIGRLSRDTGIYFTLLVFIGLQMGYLVGDQTPVLAVLVMGMAGILCWMLLHHYRIMSGYGFPVFVILLSSQFLYFVLAPEIEYYIFGILLAFFPLLIRRYLQTARPQYIPGTGAIATMAVGFIVSVFYQTWKQNGVYAYTFANDTFLLLALSVFFTVYVLLVLKLISIRQILIALTFSVLPFILITLYAGAKHGLVSQLSAERFGADSKYLSSNYLAQILDFCFPFALFLALGEKKTYLKIVFTVLSVVYCLCLVLTSSRGSIPGLLATPLFFLIKSRSIAIWLLVAALTIGVFGAFGGRVEHRILTPTRSESFSNMGRVEMIKAAHAILKANYYIFGIGEDNFRMEKLHYGFPVFFDQNGLMSSHNTFLEIWLGWGLPGLLGWLTLLIGSIIRAAKTKLPADMQYLKYGLFFGLLAFMIHSLFDSAIAFITFAVLIVSTLSCMSFLPRLDIRNSAGVSGLTTKPEIQQSSL
jgi:O-antigen ligase